MSQTESLPYHYLAIDGPMSIQGVHATGRPWNARMEEQLTILGWYERLRLARYFDTTPQFWLNLQMQYDLALNKPQRQIDPLPIR